MTSQFKKFSAWLLTGVMLSTMSVNTLAVTVPTDVQQVQETQEKATQETTAQPVPAAQVQSVTTTPGWNYNGSSFTFYYYSQSGAPTQMANGYMQIASDKTITYDNTSYVFKAGIYYFNADGSLNTNAAGRNLFPVKSVDANYKFVNQKSYVAERKACTRTVSGNTVTYSSNIAYFTGEYAGKVYYSGEPYTGYALNGSNVMYAVTNGVYTSQFTGTMKSYYVSTASQARLAPNNYYYKSGTAFTGIASKYFYKKGQLQSNYTGWKKWNSNLYYLKKGKAVTGWKYLKSYSGGKTKYKYYFKKNGVLCTDLFSKFGNSYKKKKLKIRVNLTTHNITVLLYNSSTKKYDIPAKTWVCSTARDGKSTKAGNFHLSRSSARRWFIYKKSNPYHYYQWGVWIHGTKSWFHSTMYRSKSNRSLIVSGSSGYNQLGTNQTTACIRSQAGNAKLIYDIARANPYQVPVQVYRSSNGGPFGKVTLKDTTGKLSDSQKYDPTDPNFAK